MFVGVSRCSGCDCVFPTNPKNTDQNVCFQLNRSSAMYQVCSPEASWARGGHRAEIKLRARPPPNSQPTPLYYPWRTLSEHDVVKWGAGRFCHIFSLGTRDLSACWIRAPPLSVDAVWGCEDSQWKWASGYRRGRAPLTIVGLTVALYRETHYGSSKSSGLAYLCVCMHLHLHLHLTEIHKKQQAQWPGFLHLNMTEVSQLPDLSGEKIHYEYRTVLWHNFIFMYLYSGKKSKSTQLLRDLVRNANLELVRKWRVLFWKVKSVFKYLNTMSLSFKKCLWHLYWNQI